MGSVKDLEIINEATPHGPGVGRFVFSDRYSVFDWGEMPDLIEHKGEAIALLGAYFFEKLGDMGVPTHYRGLVEDGAVKRISDLEGPSNVMEVKLLRVLRPAVQGNSYDYSPYREERGGFLIPLEVIYRNFLPPGSSVFKRLERGDITPRDLGLEGMPEPNQELDPPVLDVSTKLEVTDRYLSWEEARDISGMSGEEITALKELTNKVNDLITEEFARIGLVNEDGKIEVGYDQQRQLMLVDVLGTLDECRFSYHGMPVSKEIARIYYRDTPWHQATEEAKKKDRQRWKAICALAPDPLPPRLRDLISQAYCACTNEITGREWFGETAPLKEILEEVRGILGL
jgi:phosphoribosylaminoimidazole-succinocarboxamide synthase